MTKRNNAYKIIVTEPLIRPGLRIETRVSEGYLVETVAVKVMEMVRMINSPPAKEDEDEDEDEEEKEKRAITGYFFEHYANALHSMCSLCGQSGIIDTCGLRTPAGLEVGCLNYCICPNGQRMRELKFPLTAPPSSSHSSFLAAAAAEMGIADPRLIQDALLDLLRFVSDQARDYPGPARELCDRLGITPQPPLEML